jgi:hypothetical protein
VRLFLFGNEISSIESLVDGIRREMVPEV